MDAPLTGAGTAILIGLLLGLERQRSHRGEPELFAGIRTFPVLTLGGYLAATSGKDIVLAVFVLAIAGLAIASYVRTASGNAGATTEAVAVAAPVLGALVQTGHAMLAASSAVMITLLLTLKAPLHRLAGNVSEEEILSILKFAVVAVILLPLLPTQAIGPYGAIVPRHVGYVVVVLCGVSLGGYLLVRILGNHLGWALAGALGGLVSSTALTLSFAGKARAAPDIARPLAVGVILASTVLYLRGLLLIGVFDRGLAIHLAPRLLGLFALGLGLAFATHRRTTAERPGAMSLGNPVELGRAFALAVLFAAILVGARAAQHEFGAGGLRITGLVGGLMDVDSVAVAAARLRQQGVATTEAAAGAYLLATLANLFVKSGIVAFVGRGPLARHVLLPFGALAAVTAVLLAL
jgi:uncharacterized membrane protein (DUF4010 family)